LESQADKRIGDFHFLAEHDEQALAAYQSAARGLAQLATESTDYQPYLSEVNDAVAEVRRYIKPAAAPPSTPPESPPTTPEEAH
jgi:hypothetical protein